jgi:phosphoribosyl-dephospho-CoA transferase
MPENKLGLLRTPPWQRHELLHVMPNAWTAVLAAQSLGGIPLLTAWADRGWPVIVRRRMDGDDINEVPVGVPLPPTAGKLRIAVNIPREAVIARAAPPGLRTAARTAQPAWQPTVAALLALGKQHGIEPAAFGSLLWEHQTGLSYLSPTSDLDLIWPAHPSCDIASLLDGIARIERAAPMRIDGEIVFRQGAAANWRELRKALGAGGRREIVVKMMDGARVFNARCLPGCERVQ